MEFYTFVKKSLKRLFRFAYSNKMILKSTIMGIDVKIEINPV